jgi:biotin transport system substrate-specific component
MPAASHLALIPSAWPAARGRGLVLAVAGAALLAASASVRVPMWPVPMTMQSFAVLLLGLCLGWRAGTAAVALTLVAAALGLPVLGGHPFSLFGPTAGYLFGFLVTAAVLGLLAERGWTRRTVPLAAALVLGTVLIYGFGVLWLDLAWLHDLRAALAAGVLPFLPGDAVKAVLAGLLIHAGHRALA